MDDLVQEIRRGKKDLAEAFLEQADLSGADMRNATLSDAILRNANLWRVDLMGSNLRRADLKRTDLRYANLRGADLTDAYLLGANLSNADLSDANLEVAVLVNTNLYGSILTGTVLDPLRIPNAEVDEFERDGDFIVGYRTKISIRGDVSYEAGQCYHAPYFSVSLTECHPGLYLGPSIDYLMDNYYSGPYVKVWAKPELTHRAGDKWRTKCFFKVEDM